MFNPLKKRAEEWQAAYEHGVKCNRTLTVVALQGLGVESHEVDAVMTELNGKFPSETIEATRQTLIDAISRARAA